MNIFVAEILAPLVLWDLSRSCCIQLGGQTESFQNVGGGQRRMLCINFQKFRGGKSSPRGGKCPPSPLNEILCSSQSSENASFLDPNQIW